MLAFREALAAYRDGWARVWRAPGILLLLAGAAILLTAVGLDGTPSEHPPVLDVFEPLGTARPAAYHKYHYALSSEPV